MNLLVVCEQPGQSGPYIKAACKAGWHIVAEQDYPSLADSPPTVQADAAVLIARRVDDRVLGCLRQLNAQGPLPVVLYTDDAQQDSIGSALAAGVSVYVVDCHQASRVAALLEVARVRFAQVRQLQKDLHRARTALAERHNVDKAKGIIMQQRQVSEHAAYGMLRKLAMDRNRRIGEVANEVIAAAEVLF